MRKFIYYDKDGVITNIIESSNKPLFVKECVEITDNPLVDEIIFSQQYFKYKDGKLVRLNDEEKKQVDEKNKIVYQENPSPFKKIAELEKRIKELEKKNI